MSNVFQEYASEIRARLRIEAQGWWDKNHPDHKPSHEEVTAIAFVSASQEIATLQQQINELQA